MLFEQEIELAVRSVGATLNGIIVTPPAQGEKYFVPIDLSHLKLLDLGMQDTLRRRLMHILRPLNIQIELVFANTPIERLEENLASFSKSTFANEIRAVKISKDEDKLIIWVHKKYPFRHSVENSIKRLIASFLRLLKVENFDVHFESEIKEPTKIEFLAALRLNSPIMAKNLEIELKSRGFQLPSTEWVQNQLDVYRKEGLVVRTKSGRYVLSLAALHGLGTSKDARSPDIIRLLALARGRPYGVV